MDDVFLMKGGQPYRIVLYGKHGKTFHEDTGYSDHLPLYMLD